MTAPEEPAGRAATVLLARARRLDAHPDRREELCVELCDRERFEFWRADIRRRSSLPPFLGPWREETPLAAGHDVRGRMVGPLVRALRPQG